MLVISMMKVRGKLKRGTFACITICIFFLSRDAAERVPEKKRRGATAENEKSALSLTPRFSRASSAGSAAWFLAWFIDRMSSIASRRNGSNGAHDTAVTSLLRSAADWQLSALCSHGLPENSVYKSRTHPVHNLSAVKRVRASVCMCESAPVRARTLSRDTENDSPSNVLRRQAHAHHFLITYNSRDIDRLIEIALRTQSTSRITPVSAIMTS